MNHLQRCIADVGGVARASELYARGHPAWELRMLSEYGRIIRVRKGWYANADTSPQLLRAWRVGGRLACVSALVHYGLVESHPSDGPYGRIEPLDAVSRLHVGITIGSSRLRHPDNHRERLAPQGDDAVVLHWIATEPSPHGDRTRRLIVPLETALDQAMVCRPRTTTAWSLARDTL